MDHQKVIVRVMLLMLAVILAAGCANTQPSASPITSPLTCPTASVCSTAAAVAPVEEKFPTETDITITFTPGNQCTLEGLDSIYSGSLLDYDLIVHDQSNEAYMVSILTLAEGKTLADLQAVPVTQRSVSPFINILAANFVHGGDASHNVVKVTEGPLYVSCYVVNQGALLRIAIPGSIEVKQ